MNTSEQPHTRIFIVEDSLDVRERLVDLLNRIEGVSIVGEAESPAAAIDGIADTHPDSVLLDIHLVGGSGIEVLRAVHTRMPSITFIVLTNHPTPQYRKAYMEAGASYFLDKTTEIGKVADITIAALQRGTEPRSSERK